MNDRIKELYKVALGFTYTNVPREDWNTGVFHPIVSGKFAELIVRECLHQIDKISVGCAADGDDEQSLGADLAGMAVARHFGIE